MSSTKQKAVQLSDEAWDLALKRSLQSHPITTRPKWIENAIYEQSKREEVVNVVPVSEKLRGKKVREM